MSLSVEQKVKLLEGKDVWHTQDYEDLPSIMMADGPHGLRKQMESTDNLGLKGSIKATAFPTASLTACSFDRNLIKHMAELIAIEAQANQVNIVLGPGINIKRSPLCGRNFEYFSEDPYLTGELAASYVRAMEDFGTGTSVKHFCCNNQEKNRFFIDSIVDERALHEIYLKAFKRVVKEKPATVMASYNKINGHAAVENPLLINTLRNEWGFQGVVVSDWGAVGQKINSVKASCDLEMPSTGGYHAQEVINAYGNDIDLQKAVDASVERIKHLVNQYQKIPKKTYDPKIHHDAAKDIARQSMVLLKNEGILPLEKHEKIAMIGGFIDDMRYQAGGSSHINPHYLDQIVDCVHDYSSEISFAKGYSLKSDIDDETLINEALMVSKNADKIILFLGLPERYETEGFDRKDLNIPKNQLKLLQQIKLVNQNIVCVAVGGSVLNFSFEKDIKGLLMAYLGGQASSKAILDILYGIYNPSGRLAETFIDDIKSCNVQLNNNNNAIYYNESIFVGYRYYQSFDSHIRYPFGYGLSYTAFEYSDLKIVKVEHGYKIKVTVKNIGSSAGHEVIQLYVEQEKPLIFKARRELIGFDKIFLKRDETKEVTFFIEHDALSYYDVIEKKWMVEQGTYHFQINKNAEEVILAHQVLIQGHMPTHDKISYDQKIYDTSDFPKLYDKALPKENIIKRRPYTLNSTLKDVKRTLIGRIIAHNIIRIALEKSKEMEEMWVQDVLEQTILETPLRSLALFSSGEVSFQTVEGLIDIINLKFLKGIKKISKGQKD